MFNNDLFDVIAEVQFETLVNAEIEQSDLFKYISDYRELEETYESFVCELSTVFEIIELSDRSANALKWVLDTLYYEYIKQTMDDIYSGYALALAIKIDDREKILALTSDRALDDCRTLLSYGSVDLARWMHSMKPRVFNQPIISIIGHISELDMMEFILSIKIGSERRPNLHELICVNPAKKRSSETLKYILAKYYPSIDANQPYFSEHFMLYRLLEKILKAGDDSFLQWLLIHMPREVRGAIAAGGDRDEILREVIYRFDRTTLKLYLDNVCRQRILLSKYKNQSINTEYINSIAI